MYGLVAGQTEQWWAHNARGDGVRAIKYRLEQMAGDRANEGWKGVTLAQLAQAARDYRAGKVISEDLVVACVEMGYLSNSGAMNRDW